jgi:Calcineurin-like phosphoesterase
VAHFRTVRDPDLSLWQSAVDEVVAKRTASTQLLSEGEEPVVQRPDPGTQMVLGAAIDVTAEAEKKPLTPPVAAGPAATQGVEQFAQFCSNIARKLAWAKITGNAAEATAAALQFSQYQQCDKGWLEVAAKYEEFQIAAKLNHAALPYVTYKTIDDFVIDGHLPADATIAIVGDWGTGEDASKQVLAQIARKSPDVVIHLGDIYYSCTDFEVENYFLKIWNQYFDITKISTYTLSGNHDMYSGGAPYYRLLKTLGQPASYCCIRNDHWQFVMIDTGINDRNPTGSVPTFLQKGEVPWIEERIAQAAGRKTVLLSHHQLFTRFSNIVDPPPSGQAGLAINATLQGQLSTVIPQIALWIWGHEHDMVIYDEQQGVLARCLGNGAIPVLPDPYPPVGPPQPWHPEITADETIRPVMNGQFLTHGYAIMKLKGPNATVSYYMDNDEDNPLKVDNF